MPRAVEMRNVRRAFRAEKGSSLVALDGLDFCVEQGEFVALIGPSGCGKSTLLRIVAGLDHADSGDVAVDRSAIAYVFQDAHLLPWRTVEENVALPLQLKGTPDDAAVRRALEDVELADFARRYPAELSGGMRMRASIARALVTKPRLLLMDEPFAALDEITRQRLDERLRALWAEHGFTVLFVTHAIFEATFLAERAAVFSKRPARIVHDGPLALPSERTAALRGAPEFARAASELLTALERGSA
jgi:NitT/TauT family transport system ATP-binding protein